MIDTAGCNLYEAAAENGESRYNEVRRPLRGHSDQ